MARAYKKGRVLFCLRQKPGRNCRNLGQILSAHGPYSGCLTLVWSMASTILQRIYPASQTGLRRPDYCRGLTRDQNMDPDSSYMHTYIYTHTLTYACIDRYTYIFVAHIHIKNIYHQGQPREAATEPPCRAESSRSRRPRPRAGRGPGRGAAGRAPGIPGVYRAVPGLRETQKELDSRYVCMHIYIYMYTQVCTVYTYIHISSCIYRYVTRACYKCIHI